MNGASTKPQWDRAPARGISRVVLWILIFLAGVEFIVRGPVRFLQIPGEWNDLSQNYTASKLWLKGQSPADPAQFVSLWKQESGSRLDLTDARTHLSPPIGGLVVMAPLAALHFGVAKLVWLGVLVIAFAATVWAFAMVSGLGHGELRTLAFIAGCLALAPFQTGIASGNATVLVIGLCAMAVWAAKDHSDLSAGILFGIACSLKPQLGAFLVLYYLVRQRWRLFFTAVGTTLALVFVGALYLELRGASWVQDYVRNARGFVTANPIDAFSTVNPARFTLINLQVPFFSLTGNTSSANWMAFAVVVCLISIWLYLMLRVRGRGSELMYLGAVAVMALLPVYHRFYDAAVLVIPLCWCMTNADKRCRPIVKTTLLLMIPFLFPGAAYLQQLAANGRIPDEVLQSWWWNSIVMPHETWALLLISGTLLVGLGLQNAAAEG